VLKNRAGQKYVFLFYQNEFIPQIERRVINQYLSRFQDRPDILMTATSLFDFHRRDTVFDLEQIKQSLSDSSISIHFLFITQPPESIPGITMEEHSEDIFSAFREMSQATGGFMESSANPFTSMLRAVEALENYYLLYYIPQAGPPDGRFREISVRVKNHDYRIIHRSGYFGN